MYGIEIVVTDYDERIIYESVDLIDATLKGNRKVSPENKMIYQKPTNHRHEIIEENGIEKILEDGDEKILMPETLFLSKAFNFAYGEREEIFFRSKRLMSSPDFSEDTILEATKFKRVNGKDIVLELTEFIEVTDEEYEDFEEEKGDLEYPRQLGEFFRK